jgi:hypothetical protein
MEYKVDFTITVWTDEASVELTHPNHRDKTFIVPDEGSVVFTRRGREPQKVPPTLATAIKRLASAVRGYTPHEYMVRWATRAPLIVLTWRDWNGGGGWLPLFPPKATQRAIAKAGNRLADEIADFLAKVE